MAALTTDQRAAATRKLLRAMFIETNQTAQLDSDEVRQLLADADDGMEANASTINGWFRAGLRSKATAKQKALAIAYAAMERSGVI